MTEAFELGSGFSVAWVHTLCLIISGAVVLMVAALLIACMMHKLGDGVMAHNDLLLWSMIFIASMATVLIGVFQGM